MPERFLEGHAAVVCADFGVGAGFRCRCRFETCTYRLRQNHDTMDMVGHNDKGIQRNVWIMSGQPVPDLLYHSAIYVQPHFILHNFTEQVRPSMRAGGLRNTHPSANNRNRTGGWYHCGVNFSLSWPQGYIAC